MNNLDSTRYPSFQETATQAKSKPPFDTRLRESPSWINIVPHGRAFFSPTLHLHLRGNHPYHYTQCRFSEWTFPSPTVPDAEILQEFDGRLVGLRRSSMVFSGTKTRAHVPPRQCPGNTRLPPASRGDWTHLRKESLEYRQP